MKTGLSEKTVENALIKLRDYDLIDWDSSPGRSNHYYLDSDTLVFAEAEKKIETWRETDEDSLLRYIGSVLYVDPSIRELVRHWDRLRLGYQRELTLPPWNSDDVDRMKAILDRFKDNSIIFLNTVCYEWGELRKEYRRPNEPFPPLELISKASFKPALVKGLLKST